MLRRKFYDVLLNWKKTKKNECLLVNGARQVGKTFIIEFFGKANYKKYVYLNLLKNPEQRNIFEGSLEPKEIYKRLSLYVPSVVLVPKETLIFIDEIQVCPKARTALKFLAIDSRYDVIASGSLLGIHYNRRKNDDEQNGEVSIPVGYEREILMHGLDFEEFLWANEVSEEAIETLKGYFDRRGKVPSNGSDGINERFQKLLCEYMVVGGMPDVVNTYLKTSNFRAVYESQQKIFKAYEDDVEHYARNVEKPKIKACYNSIPRQLAKEYTKFQYKTVERNGSAKKYDNSIAWLEDAGLVCLVKNVSLPRMPLRAYEQPENFKLYTTDIGLATSMYGFETQKALLSKTLIGPAKGGMYENLVFDILYKRGLSLNYFKRNDNSQEIEFIFERDGAVIPIEVKSKKGETESLKEFIKTYNPPYAYKLIDGNVGFSGTKVTVPQYMAMFI